MMRKFTSSAMSRCGIVSTAVCARRCLSFEPRTKEYSFLMEDVFNVYDHYGKLGFADADKDLVNSLMDECAKVSADVLFPIYQSGDDEGCKLTADGVKTPKGYKEAWNTYKEGGWQALAMDSKYGGQGLPASLNLMRTDMMSTANWSFMMYPGLTMGAINTLTAHGSEQQKELYMAKMGAGEWCGTMCLTEPHCGTDLAQCKTRAEPLEDGSYKLNGTKIFISAGDHEFTENIVHIVLARLPDAPAGTKGISLFLVPKYVVKADGTLEDKKNLHCTGLESKMGIKASATCQMTFENSIGYLIGEPNKGLMQMFTFMNTARLGTAMQGVVHAELALQNSVHYARERCSMRSLSGTKVQDKPADPIIYHPDVKKMILFQKCIAEGGRAFVLDMAMLVDKINSAKDAATAKKYDNELGLLTPIGKGFLTEMGLEAANHGVQVYGGHGFIKGNGMEQIVRDARISTLYEGTTGVQALDYIGRKVLASKTGDLNKLVTRITSLASPHVMSGGPLGSCARQLWMGAKGLKVNSAKIMMGAARDRDIVGSASVDYLMYSGYVVLGFYWLKMATAAQKYVDKNQDPDGFYKAKVDTCVFYFDRVFPRMKSHAATMSNSPKSIMSVNNDALL